VTNLIKPDVDFVSKKTKAKINWQQYFSLIQLIMSVVLVLVALVWLLWPQSNEVADDNNVPTLKKRPAVEAVAFGKISIDSNSPIGNRLPVQQLKAIVVSEPVLRVTGRVIASRRPGSDSKKDYWQFNSGELLNDFSLWEKAVADVAFNESQLTQLRELAASKEAALANAIARLEKLVKSGSESEKNLIEQRSMLLQTQIQDRKDIYQAELAISIAQREARTLSLQLLQSGIDPERLENATSDMDIVTAEVPEAMIERVSVGQSCTADFFGIADSVFEGKLTAISPILSAEQHTLRVLFIVHDPLDRLRPGMFARIGLGTDPREVLKIPAESVIHIGRNDLVMVVDAPETSESTGEASGTKTRADRLNAHMQNVVVSNLANGKVDVIRGLKNGDRIIANNAILLQPVIVSSLRMIKETSPLSSSLTPGSDVSVGDGVKP
jgi:membrane fusion protein, heavy metal efflux system